MGNSTIQLFAKDLCFIFPFAMIAALWDSGNQFKNRGYFFAIPFLIILLLMVFKRFAIAGYADVPVACMSLLAFYALMLSRTYESEADARKSIIIAAVLFGGAAMTKQIGAIFILLFPLLLYFFVFDKKIIQKKSSLFLICFVIMFSYLLPWYVYKFNQIYQGIDSSAATYILHGGGYETLLAPHFFIIDKVHWGLTLIYNTIHKAVPFFKIKIAFIEILFPLLLIIGCYFNNFVSKLLLLMVFPGFLIWLFFVSYDLRNMSVILPFLAIALGMSLQAALSKLPNIDFKKDIRLYRIGVFVLLLILSIAVLNTMITSSQLTHNQFKRQKKIGDQNTNKILFTYFSTHPLNGVIISNYHFLPYLPDFTEHAQFNSFTVQSELIETIKNTHAAYILILKNPALTMQGETYVLSGNWCQIIANDDSVLFCKVEHAP